jgi:hypothetical protein
MDDIGKADSLVNECDRRMRSAFGKQLDQCQQTLDKAVSACSGCIDHHCDQAETTCDKCYRKIENSLIGQLAQVYNRLVKFGVTFPTSLELEETAAGGGRPLAQIPVAPQPGQLGPAEGFMQPPPGAGPSSPTPAAQAAQPAFPPFGGANLMPGPVPTSPTPYSGSQTPYRPFSGTNTPPGPKKRSSDCLEIDLCDDLYGWLRFWGQEAQPFFFYWWRAWRANYMPGDPANQENNHPPPEAVEKYPLLPMGEVETGQTEDVISAG